MDVVPAFETVQQNDAAILATIFKVISCDEDGEKAGIYSDIFKILSRDNSKHGITLDEMTSMLNDWGHRDSTGTRDFNAATLLGYLKPQKDVGILTLVAIDESNEPHIRMTTHSTGCGCQA